MIFQLAFPLHYIFLLCTNGNFLSTHFYTKLQNEIFHLLSKKNASRGREKNHSFVNTFIL